MRQPLVIGELDTPESDQGWAWDAFVEAHPDGTFFHRAGWKRAVETAFGHRGHYLTARRGGELVGICPLVHLRSRLFGDALVSTAFCVYGGPLGRDAEVVAELDRAAVALARRLEVGHLEYRLRAPLHDDRSREDELYATFRKEIVPEVEQNLKAIPRKQRAMVRKAIGLGLTGEPGGDPDTFHRLFAESVRNLGTPVFSKRYMKTLLEVFGRNVDILVVRNGDAAVAAVMSFYFRNEVLPYYGGSTPAARQLAANDFMYWEVMRRACEAGYNLFDFGRSKHGTGSFDFKKNWGFRPEPLTYEYFLVNSPELPRNNPTNPKYRMAISLWKRLPLWVANSVGPMISRGLG